MTSTEQRLTPHDKLPSNSKPPLPYETLRDVIDLSLWAGQLLLQSGAESQQVEETVHRFGTALGCDWLEIFISPNAIAITAISAGEFRTKLRRVVNVGANLSVVAEIHTLVGRVLDGERDRVWLRAELTRISQLTPGYNRWTVALMVGLACGAFSQLFGGDLAIFAVTLIAAAVGMRVRQLLQQRQFNSFFIVSTTAFVVSLIAGLASVFQIGNRPQLALVSSVLLLIPGVPLINGVNDLIKGYMITGIARSVTGALVAASIALGLLLAMALLRINGL